MDRLFLSDGSVDVWTDGACSSNGYQGAKAGVGVYFGDNHRLNLSVPASGRATNNSAEIEAATRAAEQARNAGYTKIRINTDSEFLVESATEWIPRWKENGWKTVSNQPVANRQEFQRMERAIGDLDVEWNYVRGHQGCRGYEQAGRLPRLQQRYRKSMVQENH